MVITLQAMAASVGIAAAGAGAAVAFFRRTGGGSFANSSSLVRAKIDLLRIDLLSFTLAASGAVTLVPEGVQVLAPELMLGHTLTGTILERLDYLAFTLVSLSFGLGLARRALSISVEQAALRPCP